MKIDLHCHTKKAKKGDLDTRKVDAKIFRESVLSAGVKIVAVTIITFLILNNIIHLFRLLVMIFRFGQVSN